MAQKKPSTSPPTEGYAVTYILLHSAGYERSHCGEMALRVDTLVVKLLWFDLLLTQVANLSHMLSLRDCWRLDPSI